MECTRSPITANAKKHGPPKRYIATMRYREQHKNDGRENRSGDSHPRARRCKCRRVHLPVDPYVLCGMWLETAVKPEVTICTRSIGGFLKQTPYEITNTWEQKGGGSWIFRIPRVTSCCQFPAEAYRTSTCALLRNSGGRCCKRAYGLRWVHWREEGAERLCVCNKEISR